MSCLNETLGSMVSARPSLPTIIVFEGQCFRCLDCTLLRTRQGAASGAPAIVTLSMGTSEGTDMDDTSHLRSIFWEVIPVLVQRPGREDTTEHLSTRLLLGQMRQHQALRVVRMHLFSDKDLFLLHTLEVSEDDFQTLKSEQGILVDFTAFADKIIQLLKRCVESHGQPSPAFQAVLSAGPAESVFKVVETNDFNQIAHINLCFRPGTDASIKSFLAFRLTEVRNQRDSLQAVLDLQGKEHAALQAEHQTAIAHAEAVEKAREEALKEADAAVHDLQSSSRQERIVQREESSSGHLSGALPVKRLCDAKVRYRRNLSTLLSIPFPSSMFAQLQGESTAARASCKGPGAHQGTS
jgi:Centriolar protein SAS N-terminal